MSHVQVDPLFWKDRRVFLTGHTGFKGGWLSIWLCSMGAKVVGYSLPPNTNPSLFEVADVAGGLEKSHLADVRDYEKLREAMAAARPEVVIHMAAQPLVRYSYAHPVETYATNVMGTVHLLECVRHTPSVRAALMVTTDKCYDNKEWPWGYRENEPMGGHDPYSNSKGCAELVVSAYRESYFSLKKYDHHQLALASARAGNVIGGGDWSIDRLIPDAIRAFEAGEHLIIRNPWATRPWQHVLEPLSGYLVLSQALFQKGCEYASPWNFGPFDEGTQTVEEVVNLLIKNWPTNAMWAQDVGEQPHEAHLLKLDCSKAHQLLKWRPKWSLEKSIDQIVQWQSAYQQKSKMRDICMQQISNYQHS